MPGKRKFVANVRDQQMYKGKKHYNTNTRGKYGGYQDPTGGGSYSANRNIPKRIGAGTGNGNGVMQPCPPGYTICPPTAFSNTPSCAAPGEVCPPTGPGQSLYGGGGGNTVRPRPRAMGTQRRPRTRRPVRRRRQY